ncbi:MAG: EamA family transporter [Moraxellaceae bacterium]|nr:EamA family transporter [Moraxellaceae bacterium]
MSQRFHLPREGIVLLASIALGWGLNWPIMKIVLSEIPPLTFRGLCLVVGGVGVLAIARAYGQPVGLPRGRIVHLLWLTFFNIIGWNVLATYGLQYLPSGRAALLGYTMPLWCVPLSVWLLGDHLNGRRIVALLLGLGGIAALMSDSFGAMLATPLGILLMVGAAWCWAMGMVLMKLWQLPMPTVVLTGWIMLLGGIPMTVLAYFVDGVPRSWPSFWPAFGIVYNTVVGFMYCYWAWNRLVLLVPVAVSSLSSLITPLVGVAAGVVVLGEQPGWREAVAAVLILGAIAVVNTGGRPKAQPVAGQEP